MPPPFPQASATPQRLTLLGLDFGTTTSKAIVATAEILRNCVTGRMELGNRAVTYRPEPVFTPMEEDQIDERQIIIHLDRWISEAKLARQAITAGGAIVTGLAAQAKNAAIIARIVNERVDDSIIVTTDDPSLESWLAFMGSCSSLSESYPDVPFLNLDIGGGTTNLALGQRGEVLSVGCLFVGARHFQFVPSTYKLTRLSAYAERVLAHLGIKKSTGNALGPDEISRILDFYVSLLESTVAGDSSSFHTECARWHEHVAYVPPVLERPPAITLSGGVGELVYKHLGGEPWPPITAFGDLGIDLAQRIAQSSVLSGHFRTYIPASFGRATVLGLALHHTEVSGTTLFLPRPEVLPLRDMPIVARVAAGDSPESLAFAIDLVKRTRQGGCIQLFSPCNTAEDVRQVGGRLAQAIKAAGFPPDRPLVIFVPQNAGKAIGSYATEWGRLPITLIVIDEMPDRRARFASLGRLNNNIVTVSFYGTIFS